MWAKRSERSWRSESIRTFGHALLDAVYVALLPSPKLEITFG